MSFTRLWPWALAALLALVQPVLAADTKVDDQKKSMRDAGKPTAATKNRIVIQINDENSKTWNAVLGNIRNIQADLGQKNARIAVVAISYGLGMVTADSVAANGVQDALAAGVEFIACGNSMTAQHVGKEDLIDGVGVAQSGYVEIMKRQQQGWTYLRP